MPSAYNRNHVLRSIMFLKHQGQARWIRLWVLVVVRFFTGCGSNASVQRCQQLENSIYAAGAGHNWSSPCISDADCTSAIAQPAYKGQSCATFCPAAVTVSAVRPYTTFWTTDPNVISTCKSFVTSGCNLNSAQMGAECGALVPKCISQICVNSAR